jgi:hypothetical protein
MVDNSRVGLIFQHSTLPYPGHYFDSKNLRRNSGLKIKAAEGNIHYARCSNRTFRDKSVGIQVVSPA